MENKGYSVSENGKLVEKGKLGRGIFGALFYSTEVLHSSSSPPFELLHSRVWQIRNPRDSILPVLHQWRVEGGDVK
ncbi:hypothetical protein GBA52_021782 [Prunus armeniaca]|nr:hypothetical protein GBA52_021782 [Prunus armeniaca]